MAKQSTPPKDPQPSVAANHPQTAATGNDAQRVPPQGAGVPQKPFSYGAPPRYVKYNIAVRVLADPVARTTFSQPYSGQRRFWGT